MDKLDLLRLVEPGCCLTFWHVAAYRSPGAPQGNRWVLGPSTLQLAQSAEGRVLAASFSRAEVQVQAPLTLSERDANPLLRVLQLEHERASERAPPP